MKRDDIFSHYGTDWRRHWIGDNGGLYVWRAHGRRLEAWRCGWHRHETVDEHGEVHEHVKAEYVATIDGAVCARAETLPAVMRTAALEWMRHGGRVAA